MELTNIIYNIIILIIGSSSVILFINNLLTIALVLFVTFFVLDYLKEAYEKKDGIKLGLGD